MGGGLRGRKIPCKRRLCNRGRGFEVSVAHAQVVEEPEELEEPEEPEGMSEDEEDEVDYARYGWEVNGVWEDGEAGVDEQED